MTEDEITRSIKNRRYQDSGTAKEKAFKRAITPAGFAKAFFQANR